MLKISSHTITTLNVTQKLLGGLKTAAASREAAAWVTVQNNGGAAIWIKSGTADSTADNTTDGIQVAAGASITFAAQAGGANAYDLDLMYVFCTASPNAYVVARLTH
jgi:hypothetical protein